jgi:hypothetical protein
MGGDDAESLGRIRSEEDVRLERNRGPQEDVINQSFKSSVRA